ncbi:MAG TPA: hypothetical protein VFV38_24535, partial [Ktedonobacteraceae bacterium]|nr:hypothetical protein [Ktedonobacteraceae bacterium]
ARQKGVHKKHLAGSVAIGEFRRNLKRISLAFMHISRHLSPFVHVSDHPLLIYYRVVLPAR